MPDAFPRQNLPQKNAAASEDSERIRRILLIAVVLGIALTAGVAWFLSKGTDALLEKFSLGDLAGIDGMLTTPTAPPPGDAERFDAFAALREVRGFAGPETTLHRIEAAYVRSDGTMDLNARYRPTAEYTFIKTLDQPPEDAPPLGAGGTAPGETWTVPVTVTISQPGERRTVTEIGGAISKRYTYTNEGMKREDGDPTSRAMAISADPQCSLQDLWRIAIQRGAPQNAVATIQYDGKAYLFMIDDTDIDMAFNLSCELINE